MVATRFDVFLTNFDPIVGSEIRKTRPCVVVSPDALNANLRTVIVAPLTSTCRSLPSRIPCQFLGRDGNILLHQLRTIDKQRLLRHLGRIQPDTQEAVLSTLQGMFSL